MPFEAALYAACPCLKIVSSHFSAIATDARVGWPPTMLSPLLLSAALASTRVAMASLMPEANSFAGALTTTPESMTIRFGFLS